MRYVVDNEASKLIARVRSSLHEVEIVWDAVRGSFELNPEDLAAGIEGSVEVEMTRYDSGDWLRNRKIRNDLRLRDYPHARLELGKLVEMRTAESDGLVGKIEGVLQWHGHTVPVTVSGTGTVNAKTVSAQCSFRLKMGQLGITVPRFLMFRMDEEVLLEATILASSST